MSWWSIAAELVKGAMSVRQAIPPKPPSEAPPNGLNLAELLQRYREEVDSGFEALSRTSQEQKARHEQAVRAQRRWNYGLLAGLVLVAVLAVVLSLRTG